jgi:hypothetical protein
MHIRLLLYGSGSFRVIYSSAGGADRLLRSSCRSYDVIGRSARMTEEPNLQPAHQVPPAEIIASNQTLAHFLSS